MFDWVLNTPLFIPKLEINKGIDKYLHPRVRLCKAQVIGCNLATYVRANTNGTYQEYLVTKQLIGLYKAIYYKISCNSLNLSISVLLNFAFFSIKISYVSCNGIETTVIYTMGSLHQKTRQLEVISKNSDFLEVPFKLASNSPRYVN